MSYYDRVYYTDYPTKPIGGGNPYHCCSYCGVSDPAINGELNGHHSYCEYRIQKEKELYLDTFDNAWILCEKGSKFKEHLESDLQDLINLLTNNLGDKSFEDQMLDELLKMEIGIAKEIQGRQLVRILIK